MLKIGEYSKLSRISVRMLRHYDEIGLLKPAEIDRFTDYRYYREDQLPTAGRITALKDMGFSLADIIRILEVYEDREQIRQLISNEKYTGNALLQKSFRSNHIEKQQRPNRGELPMYYAEGTHPAIIDEETFTAAKERLDALAASTAGWSKPTSSAFSGIVTCGQCGQKYKRVKNHQHFV